MGTNKLLMPFSDKTIIETVISNIMASGVDNILVVLGAYYDELLPVIKTMNVNHCYNGNWAQGMLSSIQCGLHNLPPEAGAFVLCLGDQPAIPGSLPKSMISEYRKGKSGIVVPVYKGRRGHPVIISRGYEQEIQELSGNNGLNELIKRHAGDIAEFETDVKDILKDIDNMQDYLELTKLN